MNEKVNRRGFLKRMAGMGALVATSQLPVLAEDDPLVFPKRGRYERLMLSYGTVNIGLEKPFSILHILYLILRTRNSSTQQPRPAEACHCLQCRAPAR